MATDPPYTVVIPPPPPRAAQAIALVTAALAAVLAFTGYATGAGISASIASGATRPMSLAAMWHAPAAATSIR